MQYNHIYKLPLLSGSRLQTVILKTIIFLSSVFFILLAIKDRPLPNSTFLVRLVSGSYQQNAILLAVILLLPVNYAIEALKWKLLVKENEIISFKNSLKAVLTGSTLSFATPFGFGDYAARLFQLQNKNRLKNTGLLLFSRLTQLQITLFFAGISFLYLELGGIKTEGFRNLFFGFGLLITNLLFLSVIIFRGKLFKYLLSQKYLKFAVSHFTSINKLSLKSAIKIFFLSAFRYLIFSTQYVFLFLYFEVSSDLPFLFIGVAFIFMAKSILPSFMDIGVREAAAIYFFSGSAPPNEIIGASICLWAINILLPALAGIFFLHRMKIFIK